MIEPRPYQLDAIATVIERRANGITRQLISLPTGCGKTIVFSLLAKEHNVRTLVIAHSEELINQAVEKFKIVWPEVDIGIVKAESDDAHAHVVVASIQTASRQKRLQKLKEQNFGLLIIDEAHHAAAQSYETLVNELGFLADDPNKLLVGVTATPGRGDGSGLNQIFQEIVFDCSISTMIRAGYLSPLVGKQIFTSVMLEGVGTRNGDFVTSELSQIVNTPERNQLIIEKYKELASDRKKVLAFCVDVQHAKDLSDAFRSSGITSSAIYGAMGKDERKQTLHDFSSGKFQVLTNCMLLTEGFDEPGVDGVLLCRPTQSQTLFVQMVGRGTRTFPMKRDCLILDFADNCIKHSLCNFKNTLYGAVAPLFGEIEEEADDMQLEWRSPEIADYSSPFTSTLFVDRVEDIEFFDKASFAWVPVGDAFHLRLAKDRDVWVRKTEYGYLATANCDGEIISLINRPLPLDYALGVCEDWARKQTTKGAWAYKNAKWRAEPPTQKQLEMLTKLGFELDYGLTKGQASQLIDSKLSEKASEPATPKQIYWMRTHGIQVNDGLTKVQARKIIADQKTNKAQSVFSFP